MGGTSANSANIGQHGAQQDTREPGELTDLVEQVIAETFEVPRGSVTATTTQDDLPEWDSLGHLNLVLALEETFGVSFPATELAHLTSVKAIADHVAALR